MKNQKSRISKQEYAYQLIRERILDGTYAPGHRIIISQLANEFSTSAIPIREAIRQLEAESLIDYKQFSGAVVAPIDENQYLETLTTLAVLSGYATALGCKYITEEQVNELSEINDHMKVALEDFDFVHFGQLNRKFHDLSYSCCPNNYLLETITNIYNHLDTIRRAGSTFLMVRAKESIEEHNHIVRLLKAKKNHEEIEEFVREHKLNTVRAYQKRKLKLQSDHLR